MSQLIVLTLGALAASTLSGAIGMGGGTLLLAVMAWVLAPELIVPLHGLVQMTSNGFRAILLLRRVAWWAFLMYVPTQLLGVFVARQIYRDLPAEWLRPIIGIFLLWAILFRHIRPKRLVLPRWLFLLGGFGGGLLTIFVGVTGPYLAAFFLRDDMEKEQIVSTKAVIQWVGHAAKIPAFLSLGFDYAGNLDKVLPLMVVALAGTWLGTRLLFRMRNEVFRRGFDIVLGLLALRLLLDRWL